MRFRLLAPALAILLPLAGFAQDLPSWQDGAARSAIVDFVTASADPASEGFIPPEDRIAVFDNDGTLWSEQPVYFQFLFAIDRAKELAAADAAWASTEALKAAGAGDIKGVVAGGEKAMLEVVSATHSGMTLEAFTEQAGDWVRTAQHPTAQRPYIGMTYQPMIEVLDLLRANDYDVYIVSGGGVDFMRGFSEEAYGIPVQNVIGSLGKATFQEVDGVWQVMKDPGVAFIDDKEGKPVGIARNIGKRPVFVAGNSDGDLQMLQWASAGTGPRFGMIVHHTDAKREWAYDRKSPIGTLDKALDAAPAAGWLVVDMANDWLRIHPGDPAEQ